MKSITLFLLQLLCLDLYAQTITVSGQIENHSDGKMYAVVFKESERLDGRVFQAEIENDGSFELEMESEGFSYVKLGYKEIEFPCMPMVPGETLELSFDARTYRTSVQFSGKGAVVADWYFQTLGTQAYLNLEDDVYEQRDPVRAKSRVDSFRNASNKSLLSKKDSVSETMFQLMHWDLTGTTSRLLYALGDAWKSRNAFGTFTLFSDQSAALRSFHYKSYCEYFILDAATQFSYFTRPVSDFDQLSLELARVFFRQPMQEFLVANIIAGTARNYNAAMTDKRISAFKNAYPESSLSPLLDAMNTKMAGLKPGQPALDFTLKDEKGNAVSLSDFKGKSIVLHFWAEWCGPCLGDLRNFHYVRDYFKGRSDLVFLHVNIDTDETLGKQMMHDMGMDSTQNEINLFTGGLGFNNEVVKLYQVSAIPSTFLIDRNFNFHAMHAPPIDGPRPVMPDSIKALFPAEYRAQVEAQEAKDIPAIRFIQAVEGMK